MKWRTKPFPLYDEIFVLVEGRHTTGENAFRIAAMTGTGTDSDKEDNNKNILDSDHKANCDGFISMLSIEQHFYDDWVHFIIFICCPIDMLTNDIIFIEFLLTIFPQGDNTP